MRLLRIVGVAVGGLLLLALLAAWLVPPMLDWNRYRDAIANVASSSLGRPVQITGPVSLILLPHPVLVASGVTLPDRGDGSSAAVSALRLQVAFGALWAGRLDPEDLTLQGARMRLPWPLRAGILQRPPGWLVGLRARVEDGILLVGGLSLTDITGTLASDPATGTFIIDGSMAGVGRRWRVTARLGRAGGDGSAPLDASLDAAETGQDIGGTFTGQLAMDGVLTGRVVGQGRDLSQLIAGPAAPWHAAGRFRGADGLALADDMDVEIGGAAARAALALRLWPEARLDAALASSRLDLGAWLPSLLHAAPPTLPTSVDLSVEAATLAGGTLRHLRTAFDLGPNGVTLRESEAVLPGDATVTITGRQVADRFTGTGRLAAPTLRETLRWLQPLAPALVSALPPDVLQTATLASNVTVAGGKLTLDDLVGSVDGGAIAGSLALLPGDHPEISGTLSLAGLNIDPWLPALPADLAGGLSAWPGRWGQLGVALTIAAPASRWHGAPLGRLDLDVALQSGTLTLRRATVVGPDFSASATGTLTPGGRIADGRIDGMLGHAALLAALLPPEWLVGVLQGSAVVQTRVAGLPNALGVSLRGSVGDLLLDGAGTADLGHRGLAGTVNLHHPGAPRLLAALGLPGVAPWLGDGSFSLAAGLAIDPAHVALSDFTLSAGMLRTRGSLDVDRRAAPAVTGRIDADTLPLPSLRIRSPEPLPVSLLRGWRAELGLRAAHVLCGLSPVLDNAAASVSLADGVLHVSGLTSEVAGGRLTGTATLDVAGAPHLSVKGDLVGARISGAMPDGAIDVTSGVLTASAALQADGFSPAGLLATLGGVAQVSVSDGVLTGVDLAAVDAATGLPDAAAAQAGVMRALQGGSTPFTQLSADLTARGGAVQVRQAALTATDGSAALSGTLDLPIDSADLLLALKPVRPAAPSIGLRLIGPVSHPHRTPELAALAGWLAAR